MDSSQEMLRRIAALPDGALQEGVRKVAEAMGVDPRLAGAYLRDPEAVRRAAQSLGPKEIETIRQKLGEETMSKLTDSIQKSLGEL